MANDIGLVAKLGSGKTTMAGMLEGRGYERLALAGPLKQAAVEMLNGFFRQHGMPEITLDDLERDKHVYRPFLQWLGTDLVREHLGLPTFWIDCFEESWRASKTPVVCDDVRFENEVQALENLGFTIVKVVRDEPDRLTYLRTKYDEDALAEAMAHRSEREVDLIEADVCVANTSLAALEAAAEALVTSECPCAETGDYRDCSCGWVDYPTDWDWG